MMTLGHAISIKKSWPLGIPQTCLFHYGSLHLIYDEEIIVMALKIQTLEHC
jgi:hypothetical protein